MPRNGPRPRRGLRRQSAATTALSLQPTHRSHRQALVITNWQSAIPCNGPSVPLFARHAAVPCHNRPIVSAKGPRAYDRNLSKTRLGLAAGDILPGPAPTRAETAVQAWVQRYNGPGNDYDQPTAVAVDGSNNVIVTGSSTGSGSYWDYATIKYSSAGVPLWTNRYNGPGNGADTPSRGGGRQRQRDRDGGFDGSGGNYDYATIKYSSAGVPLWTNRYNGPGNDCDQATAVAVDGSSNVIVTGDSVGSGGSRITRRSSIRARACRSGPTATTGRGTRDDATALAVDGSDNVIVTGYSFGSVAVDDYATIKYSSAGEPLWTNRYNGPGNGEDVAYAVAVDGSNNVIVTGRSAGSGAVYDYATIKYSSAGEPLGPTATTGRRTAMTTPTPWRWTAATTCL